MEAASVPYVGFTAGAVMRGTRHRVLRDLCCREVRRCGTEKGGNAVIEVTKINGVKILVNPHLFEIVEETPDTVITLTTGKKIIVKESRQEIKNLVKLYRKDIFAD